jgi:signal peptidase II
VVIAASVALVADIVSKVIIVATITAGHRPVRVLGGVVSLVQERNSGAAFSVGTGATIVLTVISVTVVVIIARTARRLTSSWWAVSLGLVLGGALGNLVDRFFRAPAPGRGHVVDWIAVHTIDGYQYPIFNIADSAIVCGAVIAVVLSVLGIEFRAPELPAVSSEEPDSVAESDG